jgi:type IV pilus assembly protein PilP
MRASRIALSLAIVTTAIAAVFAQTPGAKPAGSPSTTHTSGTSSTSSTSGGASSGTPASADANVQQSLQEILEEKTTAESYRYDPQGRRDPFQSLIGPMPRLQDKDRPAGIPGFLIDEIKFQGVVRTRAQGLIAMVNGPDNKGYMVRVGDKVLDGEVIRITPSSVVFRQEVNDPTRIERFREVVKELVPEAAKKP